MHGLALGRVAVLLCLPACLSWASEFTTDRPDFTESADVVGRGIAQIESGFAFARTGDKAQHGAAVTFPSSLLRVGLGGRVELRVGGDGFVWREPGTGLSDHDVQFKTALVAERRFLPALSLIGGVSIPIGSRELSSRGYDPGVKLAIGKQLPASFGITGNLNVASVSESGRRLAERAWSASVSHALTAGFAGYWEFYGSTSHDIGARSNVVFDSGVTHKVGRSVQIDVEAGRAVQGSETAWFIGFGFAIRHSVGGGIRSGT